MEGKNFPSYHRHFLMLKKAFRHFLGGGVGGVKKPSLTFAQLNTQNFIDTSDILFLDYFGVVRRGGP